MDTKILQGGGEFIKMISSQSQMAPSGFLVTLRDFSVDTAGTPVDTLADLRNEEITQAADMIAPRHPLLGVRAQIAPCFTEGLQGMKRLRQLGSSQTGSLLCLASSFWS